MTVFSRRLLHSRTYPVLFYHGREAWPFPSRLNSLFNAPEPFVEFVPNFRYQLIDLSQYADETIKGQALLSVGLLIMKYIFRSDLAQRLPGILALLSELAEQQTGIQYLYTILRYLSVSATSLNVADLRQTVRNLFATRGEEIMATIAEQWLEQGQQEGRQEGRQEGLLAGIELALELKFGLEGLALWPEIARISSLPQLQAIVVALRQVDTAGELREIVHRLASDEVEAS